MVQGSGQDAVLRSKLVKDAGDDAVFHSRHDTLKTITQIADKPKTGDASDARKLALEVSGNQLAQSCLWIPDHVEVLACSRAP